MSRESKARQQIFGRLNMSHTNRFELEGITIILGKWNIWEKFFSVEVSAPCKSCGSIRMCDTLGNQDTWEKVVEWSQRDCALCASVKSKEIELLEAQLFEDDNQRNRIQAVMLVENQEVTFNTHGHLFGPHIRYISNGGWIPTWLSQTGMPTALERINCLARALNVAVRAVEGFLVLDSIHVASESTRLGWEAKLDELRNHRATMNLVAS